MNQTNQPKRKPKLLIIGHARHGKDTVAKLISESMGLKFKSSSEFVGRNCIWDAWGKERYNSFEEMFEDRVNYRKTWADLIEAYNTPDASRTATEMLEAGCHMYVGMRRIRELRACVEQKLFDHIIWVDASKRLPDEPYSSNELCKEDADIILNNNGTEKNLVKSIDSLKIMFNALNFDVNSPIQEKENTLTWFDKPEGATSVLDHGFVQVKEVMGSDLSIVESAQMSYGRGTKKTSTVQGLINYLMRNRHTSPIEMGEIRFHMRLPIFVMRQLVRHRTASLNEYSARYSEMVPLFYIPELENIRHQGTINKQKSGESLPQSAAVMVQNLMVDVSTMAYEAYEELLNKRDVSREIARIILPLNIYTECVWKMDTSNLIKFLFLRDDEHAQWEIQQYAKEIAKAVEQHFPKLYNAYMRERNSVNLTELQIECLVQGKLLEGLSTSESKIIEDILAKYT